MINLSINNGCGRFVNFLVTPPILCRVGSFWQKNYSSEDRKDGTIDLFQWNSSCSAEQKTLGIPFRTVPQRRKMLRILYQGTKVEENSQNFVLNHSAEQKILGILFRTVPKRRKTLRIPFRGKKMGGKNRSKLSEFRSKACLGKKTCCLFCLLEQDILFN